MDNNYLLFIGVAFLFIGGVALLHTLAYEGMNVFPEVSPNLATQLWIAVRYLLSFSLLTGFLFVRRKFRPNLAFIGFATVFALLLGSIFHWQNFPAAYTDGAGLTPFKVVSEYVVSAILLGAIALLLKTRETFDGTVVKYLIAAMATVIAGDVIYLVR
jgi:hypothetical protein